MPLLVLTWHESSQREPPFRCERAQRVASLLRENFPVLVWCATMPNATPTRRVTLVLFLFVLVAVVALFFSTRPGAPVASVWVLPQPDWGGKWETRVPGVHFIPPEVTPPRRVVVAMARDIETPTVAEAVIRRLGLRMTPDELLGNLTVEPDAQSSGIKLSYRDPARETPQRARKIVRAFVVVADEHIRVETPYDYAWVLG
jgi:hypothetical protein